jgi:hypothetical protein
MRRSDVAYYLTFFCRSGEENGSSALATILSKLTETGDPVLIKRDAVGYVDEVDACELATDNSYSVSVGWRTWSWRHCRRSASSGVSGSSGRRMRTRRGRGMSSTSWRSAKSARAAATASGYASFFSCSASAR